MDVPDDVREAERIEAELFVHTHSPGEVLTYLHCLAVEKASAHARYQECRARGSVADREALAVSDEIHALYLKIGTVMDDLRATEKAQRIRELRGGTVVAWRDDA